MSKYTIVLAALLVFAAVAYGNPRDPNVAEKMAMTITASELKVTEKTIELRYQIKNESGDDLWLCDEIDAYGAGFEHYLSEDGKTLRVRRRLGVLMTRHRNQPIGRYLRLRAHKSRTESLLLHLPVYEGGVLTGSRRGRATSESLRIKRLVLEIGFYNGDLPKILRGQVWGVHPPVGKGVAQSVGGLWSFLELNESLRNREERVVYPWTIPPLQGEQVAQMVVENLSVPWVGGSAWSGRDQHGAVEGSVPAPRLGPCTRAEIRYAPSMLEFFYPYVSEQSLLSPSEKDYLRAQRTITVEDEERLAAFVREVAKGFQCEIVTEESRADVVCYKGDERVASLIVYDNTGIETNDKQRFRYSDGLQSMRQMVQPIQPFELRLQCADDLRNLWYRLRFCRAMLDSGSTDPSDGDKAPYPDSTEWCSQTEAAFRFGRPGHSNLAMYKCPSAGDGKCHYAMNPDCKVDSPPDTVLLFETKAGWNQHGGPELFTFDNHDPKGGCVLLNDGTVKFIRTKEELAQLRWGA